ncbi:MAG: aldo/keto reductase [Clostridiaceae bacterium]|nr:aldo/keto reductase [Clostridiaceae bacterium]
MEYRDFPNIKGSPSLLGFGLMRLPLNSDDPKDINYELGREMISRALDRGINYFDTAYMYHGYMSEIFVGEVLTKFPRDSFLLADKLPINSIDTLDQAKEIFAHQLEKCQVEFFDFYLLHSLHREAIDKVNRLGIYELLADYKAQGVIKNLGFSIHDTPDVVENFTLQHDWDMVQIQLNYVDWELQNAKRSYQFLAEQNIPVVVMEPVRGGSLANLPADCKEKLKEADSTVSAASWAIRFVASLSGVLTILSGMSNPEQLEDNLCTIEGAYQISQAESDLLDEVRKLYLSSGRIPCTDCQYCMPCPYGVNIPESFSVYNRYLDSDDGGKFCKEYVMLDKGQPDACTECRECEPKCPQKIKISEELKKPRSYYEHITAPGCNL